MRRLSFIYRGVCLGSRSFDRIRDARGTVIHKPVSSFARPLALRLVLNGRACT